MNKYSNQSYAGADLRPGCSYGRGPRANRPSTSSRVSASTPLAASCRSPSRRLEVLPSGRLRLLALSGRRSWTRESWALPRWPRSLQALAGPPSVVDARRLQSTVAVSLSPASPLAVSGRHASHEFSLQERNNLNKEVTEIHSTLRNQARCASAALRSTQKTQIPLRPLFPTCFSPFLKAEQCTVLNSSVSRYL